MARDRLLTTHKIARAEGALEDLLACRDIEFTRVLRQALKATKLLGRWHAALVEDGAADDDDRSPGDELDPDADEPTTTLSAVPDGSGQEATP